MAGEHGRKRERGRAAVGPRRGSAIPRSKVREPRLTRTRSRAGTVVKATTGLLGLSSTRRAAVLAIVVCALALTVAIPLRNYVAQRQELAAVMAQQEVLTAEVERLTRERARLSDPVEIAAQARARLGYVVPGEVPYVVQLPAPPQADPDAEPSGGSPWYQRLWRDVGGRP